jgi:DNA-binding response OmpR family regulator
MKGKILVVDDEEITRLSLAEILRLEGCQVRSVSGGEAALDALEQEKFDLMLLDLKMPGMDGLDVMRAAAQIAPETQIIFLTAHGSLESSIEALRYGAHDYLLKPASQEQIIRSVASGLARRLEIQQRQQHFAQIESSLQLLKGEGRVARQQGLLGMERGDVAQLVLVAEGIILDIPRREIRYEGKKINLTPTEGKLLKVLLENRHRVFAHRELVLMVQGYETTEWEAPEVLRPLVSRLRRKLAPVPGGENWIVNIRGTGYVFEGEA